MKKILFLSAIAIFGALNAQKYGVKAGMNLSSISNSSDMANAISEIAGVQVDSKMKVGFHAGFFMNSAITEKFSIQPELIYNSKGVKFTAVGQDLNWNIDYLSVPVMFQYNATPQFSLEAGPEINLLLSTKLKASGVSEDMKEGTNGFDLGLGVGATFNFSPKIGANIRYVGGLTDIIKDNTSNTKFKNNTFQFGLGYKF